MNVSPGANGQDPMGTEYILGTTSNCCDIDNLSGVLSYNIGWTSSNGDVRPAYQIPDYNVINYCEWAASLPLSGIPGNSLPTFILQLS